MRHEPRADVRGLPLYAARMEDLRPGDFVKVDCAVLTILRAREHLGFRLKVTDNRVLENQGGMSKAATAAISS